MKKLTAECDYTMPVLSEQEREAQIQYCCARESSLLAQIESYKQFDGVDSIVAILQKDLISQQIALAALTAKPVAYEVKGLLCHTLDEAEIYVGDPEPLYDVPPVPVKQEGEQ